MEGIVQQCATTNLLMNCCKKSRAVTDPWESSFWKRKIGPVEIPEISFKLPFVASTEGTQFFNNMRILTFNCERDLFEMLLFQNSNSGRV
jgi:hypothetical protein